MKLTNLLLLFLCLGLTAMAQEKARYTYVTDKVFHQGSELYGYTLVPNEWEDASGSHGKLAPGEVAFSIFRGYLVVKGTKSEGSYSINRIEKEGNRMLKKSFWMTAEILMPTFSANPATTTKLSTIKLDFLHKKRRKINKYLLIKTNCFLKKTLKFGEAPSTHFL